MAEPGSRTGSPVKAGAAHTCIVAWSGMFVTQARTARAAADAERGDVADDLAM
jgi:hypothetical protein